MTDTMSGVLAMGSNRITNMADPTGTQDSATKNYVDVLDILKFVITTIQNSIGSDILFLLEKPMTMLRYGL